MKFNLVYITNISWGIGSIGDHDLDFSGSSDFIDHVTIRFAVGHSHVLSSISIGFRDHAHGFHIVFTSLIFTRATLCLC